mmetsp:Transcript_98533/g.169771  ORF Transcript_98533/g.169771 Transcript_98533/m.169771 type:complete len:218 (-) Transcript_98533:682-1335(-)
MGESLFATKVQAVWRGYQTRRDLVWHTQQTFRDMCSAMEDNSGVIVSFPRSTLCRPVTCIPSPNQAAKKQGEPTNFDPKSCNRSWLVLHAEPGNGREHSKTGHSQHRDTDGLRIHGLSAQPQSLMKMYPSVSPWVQSCSSELDDDLLSMTLSSLTEDSFRSSSTSLDRTVYPPIPTSMAADSHCRVDLEAELQADLEYIAKLKEKAAKLPGQGTLQE